jgi:DNA-binding transcriptional LysR family regulator
MFRPGYDLREVALRACRDAGFSPALAAEGLEMGGVLAMTAAGIGAAVVPESVVVEGGPLHAVRFEGRRLTRTVGLASRRDRPLVQAAKALVHELERQLSQRPESVRGQELTRK